MRDKNKSGTSGMSRGDKVTVNFFQKDFFHVICMYVCVGGGVIGDEEGDA